MSAPRSEKLNQNQRKLIDGILSVIVCEMKHIVLHMILFTLMMLMFVLMLMLMFVFMLVLVVMVMVMMVVTVMMVPVGLRNRGQQG